MLDLYHKTCEECSKLITNRYSTSFSLGTRVLHKKFRQSIYGIYGFVRFADEIVDEFHQHDKEHLLQNFINDTFKAIDEGISLNPVLHSFQRVVNTYNIDHELIQAFFNSMAMDLDTSTYCDKSYNVYIYGSAEVVGLMCLHVFTQGDKSYYKHLKAPARSLGSAFQKVNFLRDIKDDFKERGRTYFPDLDFENFTTTDKKKIEEDIKRDFDHAFEGIIQLPKGSKFGVYLAYKYYLKLFKKIKKAEPSIIKENRLRVHDVRKIVLLFSSALRYKLNIL